MNNGSALRHLDSRYGIARFQPDPFLVDARRRISCQKTSIECVVGQRKMFAALMDETKQNRSIQSDSKQTAIVDQWSKVIPKPNWNAVLKKKKRRTKHRVYVEDKKKEKVLKELNLLATRYYETRDQTAELSVGSLDSDEEFEFDVPAELSVSSLDTDDE